MSSKEEVEIWYVTPHGHADRPLYAVKDRGGNPIVSSGPMRKMIQNIERNQKKAVKQIWEDLLDTMEEIFQLKDEGWGDNDKDMAKLLGKQEALTRTLAMLQFGNEFQEDPEASYAWVTAKAESMFEE